MRAASLLSLMLLGSCDSLWRPFDRNHPDNCVQDPSICRADQLCSPQTELCEPRPDPPPVPLLHRTCAELKAQLPESVDGEYTLYLNGDPARPWLAYCNDMAGQPAEFLTLPAVANFSQYTAGGASAGTTVRTTYQRIRLDPTRLLVHVGIQTFSVSTGRLTHSNTGVVVTSMPYGGAADCLGGGSAAGIASIDLTGTAFAVVDNAFYVITFPNPPAGKVTYTMNNQIVTVTGGGFCGFSGSYPVGGSVQNQDGTFQLPLMYVGP